MVIEQLAAANRLEVEALLASADLAIEDLDDATITLYVTRAEAGIVGVVGLQHCGSTGLLRSLAVAPSARGRGIAQRLCAHVLDVAIAASLSPVYLLTTTARDFFARLGFTPIARSEAPPSIRASRQFASLCPESATVMRSP